LSPDRAAEEKRAFVEACVGMLSLTDDEPKRISRRDWVKIGLAVGGASAAAASGVTLLGPLLSGPRSNIEFRDVMHYTRFPSDQWWNGREGSPIRVTDFQEWQGATGVWHDKYIDGQKVPETGLPILAIRVKRDDSVFVAPSPADVPLPVGFNLYYDDPARDIRIVVVYDRCAHLCCVPGWQVVQNPPPGRDYVSSAPTFSVYGLDPIYCVCHGSQYDPMVLLKSTNPMNGVTYVGPSRVHGPSSRAIPVIPVKAVDDELVGGMPDPRWYEYC